VYLEEPENNQDVAKSDWKATEAILQQMDLEEVAWSTDTDRLAKATMVLYTDSTISQPYLSSLLHAASIRPSILILQKASKRSVSNMCINIISILRDDFKTGIPVSVDRANLFDAPDADVPKNSNAWPRQPHRSSDNSWRATALCGLFGSWPP
jgi:hypothetical protein